MAYEVKDDEDEKDSGQPEPTEQSPGGLISAGQSQAPADAQNAGGGNYATLQKYMNLNQGQATGLAQKVAAPTQQLAQESQSLNQPTLQDFQNRVNTSSFKQDDYDRIKAGLQTTPYSRQENQITAPTLNRAAFDFTQEPNKDLVREAVKGQYNGPLSIVGDQGYQQAESKAKAAQERAVQTQSEAGRFNLLNQMFAKPSYTKGSQSLDQMLLQNAPGARQIFENSQNQAKAANEALGQTLSSADQSVQSERDRLANESAAVRTGIPTAYNSLADSYSQMAQYLEPQRANALSPEFLSALSSSQKPAQGLQSQIGLKDNVNLADYGLNKDLTPYLNQGVAFTQNSVADPYRNDLAALSELGGFQNQFTPEDVADPMNPYFNKEGLQSDILKRSSDYTAASKKFGNTPIMSLSDLQRSMGDHGEQYRTQGGAPSVDENQYEMGLKALQAYRQKLGQENDLRNQYGLTTNMYDKVNTKTGPSQGYAVAPDFNSWSGRESAYNQLTRSLNDYQRLQQFFNQTQQRYDPAYLQQNVFGAGNAPAQQDEWYLDQPVVDRGAPKPWMI